MKLSTFSNWKVQSSCHVKLFFFLKETSSLAKWKRGEQGRSWFFNLPFVPCSEPQENPVMAAISCVFNMQDTHTHILGIRRCIHFPLTWLQIITTSRHTLTHMRPVGSEHFRLYFDFAKQAGTHTQISPHVLSLCGVFRGIFVGFFPRL